MKYLFSRFGGHAVIIGKGKASDENLPEDQSLDNMLDNYSTEIIKNLFYCSSYDMVPEYMGAYKNLEKGAVKLGDVYHPFYEFSFQHEINVVTSVYIAKHSFNNVFAVFIKTEKSQLRYVIDDYEETYDYVLTVFYRNNIDKFNLIEHPKLIEKLLLILFFKMDLQYGFNEFIPSRTYLGKRISSEFVSSLEEAVKAITNEDELSAYLKNEFN